MSEVLKDVVCIVTVELFSPLDCGSTISTFRTTSKFHHLKEA